MADDLGIVLPSLEVIRAARAIRESKIKAYYPESGPLGRANYPKHMEFFRQTKTHQEVAFFGGNRCLTPWSVLQTDRGERQIGELLGAGAPVVRSWDGVSRCWRQASPVFLKCIEPAFRLLLSNGELLDCTLGHRILTVIGWRSLRAILRASRGCWFNSVAVLTAHLPLVGGSRITSVVPLGPQPILDLNVAGTSCYESAGVINHNTGKTSAGAYSVALHMTGEYPDWWPGRRWDRPVKVWVAGDTGKSTREIVQEQLLGSPGAPNSGFLTAKNLYYTTPKVGIPDAIELFYVRHKSGGISEGVFKCHPSGSRVKMADGTWARIEDVRLGDMVQLADGVSRRVEQTHAYSGAPVLEVRTRAGSIRVTPNHRMFTTRRGALEARHLKVGDELEVATSIDASSPREDWLVKATALIIGDGCVRGRTPFFTCNEPPIVDLVRAMLPAPLSVVPIRNTISYKISSSSANWNPLTESLRADGLWGLKSTRKFIPDWVFALPRHQKVEFLRWLWGCDGTVNSKSATYTSSSRRLIDDVRLLLWDLGIHEAVREHTVSCNGKKFIAYYLPLAGHNRVKFTAIGKLNRDAACTLKPNPKGPHGEVLAVSPCLSQDVYGLGVESVHELIVDGFRVANSYDQRREAFQGAAIDLSWFDEECPLDIYEEAMMRLMTTEGLMLLTMTPLNGMTELVTQYLSASSVETGV